MIARGPTKGSLWIVNSNSLLGCTLEEFIREDKTICWYIFEDLIFIPRESTLLYLGEEILMVSHWDLLNKTDYESSDEFYNSHEAAIFLYNDKKIYIFYDDHYDLWEKDVYLRSPI